MFFGSTSRSKCPGCMQQVCVPGFRVCSKVVCFQSSQYTKPPPQPLRHSQECGHAIHFACTWCGKKEDGRVVKRKFCSTECKDDHGVSQRSCIMHTPYPRPAYLSNIHRAACPLSCPVFTPAKLSVPHELRSPCSEFSGDHDGCGLGDKCYYRHCIHRKTLPHHLVVQVPRSHAKRVQEYLETQRVRLRCIRARECEHVCVRVFLSNVRSQIYPCIGNPCALQRHLIVLRRGSRQQPRKGALFAELSVCSSRGRGT